ncbi:hypothetical protein [Maricaulis salignorans]|nr:hypothetical protein [Maricaulis salignorans]
MMPFSAVTRSDILRRTACGDGVLATSGSTMSMTITMTTSGMRGQVGVD